MSRWLAPRDGVIWPGAGRDNNKELGKRRRPRLRTGTDMGHSAIDRRLDELKAVLQRFQHFEQASVGPAPASKDATHPSRAPPRRAAIAPIFAAAAVMLTVLGTYTFFSCKQCPDSSARLSANRPLQGTATPDETVPSRSKATVPPAPPAARAVVQRPCAMASGQIMAAGTELVRTEASADVAWALAPMTRTFSAQYRRLMQPPMSYRPRAGISPGTPLQSKRVWLQTVCRSSELFAQFKNHPRTHSAPGACSFAGRLERERRRRMQRLQVLVVEVAGY